MQRTIERTIGPAMDRRSDRDTAAPAAAPPAQTAAPPAQTAALQPSPPPLDVDALAEQVERRLARRMAIERERRGWRP